MSVQDCKLFDLLDGFEMTKSQHDWLERRFENMTKKESLLFRGAMQIEQPRMTCDVMLIASQLDHYDLFYGAGDDVQLGKFIMEQIQRPPDQAREFLDPEKVGSAYRQKGGNTFCDGHFIKVTSLIDPFLDGDPSMNPDKGDFAIRVKLASRTNMDGVWVGFPDTGEYMDAAHPDELLLALDELEAESLTECIAVEVDCCLPQLRDILSQYDSAAELIRHAIDFGYVWAEQGQGLPPLGLRPGPGAEPSLLQFSTPQHGACRLRQNAGKAGRHLSHGRTSRVLLRCGGLRQPKNEKPRPVGSRAWICVLERNRDPL